MSNVWNEMETMTEFKVGDRVEIINYSCWNGPGTVIEIGKTCLIVFSESYGENGGFNKSDLRMLNSKRIIDLKNQRSLYD